MSILPYVPPAGVNVPEPSLTTPLGAGQSVGHPQYMGSKPDGSDFNLLRLRSDFEFDSVQSIDAPGYLPCGSHRVDRIHETSNRWFFTNGFSGPSRFVRRVVGHA